MVAVLLHHRMKLVADLGDLAPAEILVAAMIVQPEHRGEPPVRAGRLQNDGLRRRPVRELPAQVLDVQPVVDELMLKLRLRDRAGVGLHQAATKPRPRPRAPGVKVAGLEPRIAKRQPRRPFADQPRRPGTIGPNHIGLHPAPPLS